MKTLYLDCGMGAAGDMLTAALLELLPEPDRFVDKMNSLGIPGVEYIKEESVKCGVTGTHVTVKVNGVEEGEMMHHHHHDHDDHDHGHHHSHNNMAGIRHIVTEHMSLPTKVAEDVMSVYSLIADAESQVH